MLEGLRDDAERRQLDQPAHERQPGQHDQRQHHERWRLVRLELTVCSVRLGNCVGRFLERLCLRVVGVPLGV